MGINTVLSHAGLSPREFHGFVNPPIVRASTVLFESVEAMQSRTGQRYSYGLTNTPTIEALVAACNALDGAAGTVLVPSGLAAVTTAILTAVRPGGKILVPDNVYSPTRRFCDESLPAFGVQTVYYDPLIGGDCSPLTWRQSAFSWKRPGSSHFRDAGTPAHGLPAAKATGSSPCSRIRGPDAAASSALDHGHRLWRSMPAPNTRPAFRSASIGSISANEAPWPALKAAAQEPRHPGRHREIWLTLRGLRTMGVRLERHERSALERGPQGSKARPEWRRVSTPPSRRTPATRSGSAISDRSTGLFGIVLRGDEPGAGLPECAQALAWVFLGRFESLPCSAELETRTVRPWTEGR
jgi:cystathionine beta-lyase